MDVFDALCGRDVIGGFDSLHDFQMVIIAMLFIRSIHFHGIPGANGFHIHWRCLGGLFV